MQRQILRERIKHFATQEKRKLEMLGKSTKKKKKNLKKGTIAIGRQAKFYMHDEGDRGMAQEIEKNSRIQIH